MKSIRIYIVVIALIANYVCGIYNYNNMRNTDYTAQIREISDYLEKEQIKNGYATFWNAAVITEFSNGEIDVWSHTPGHDMLENIDEIFEWAQVTEHKESKPQGKVFLLFSKEEYESSAYIELLKDKEAAYSNSNYILYLFDSYEQLKQLLTAVDYKFDFSNNVWLLNGEDKNGIRYLYKDGISFGPYITLYPGTYDVHIRGEHLDEAICACTYNSGSNYAEIRQLRQNFDQVSFKIIISEKVTAAEITITNTSDKTLTITELSIAKSDSSS